LILSDSIVGFIWDHIEPLPKGIYQRILSSDVFQDLCTPGSQSSWPLILKICSPHLLLAWGFCSALRVPLSHVDIGTRPASLANHVELCAIMFFFVIWPWKFCFPKFWSPLPQLMWDFWAVFSSPTWTMAKNCQQILSWAVVLSTLYVLLLPGITVL
jgi:hypothetical protein